MREENENSQRNDVISNLDGFAIIAAAAGSHVKRDPPIAMGGLV
jgi:hypothetical protein